jgi:hypothetical protein
MDPVARTPFKEIANVFIIFMFDIIEEARTKKVTTFSKKPGMTALMFGDILTTPMLEVIQGA